MTDNQPDIDAEFGDGPAEGRWARHVDGRRRLRRRAALGLAAVGVGAIAFGLAWNPGGDGGSDKPGVTPQSVDVKEGTVTESTAKPPTTGPGGVGENPGTTGLPAQNAPGGRVRTGTKDEGCFANMREYLDAWDRTGVEPEPCFLSQEPSEQDQPDDVVRSYNGEEF